MTQLDTNMDLNNPSLIKALLISIITVFAHWNIWSIGLSALGFNTTLFFFGVCYLVWGNDPHLNFTRDWQWSVPIILIAVSFSLFENPWLKLISCFLLPISVAIFYGYSQIQEREKYYWNLNFAGILIARALLPLEFIDNSLALLKSSIKKLLGESESTLMAKRIAKGLLILLPLAALVLLLLASADRTFSNIVEQLSQNIFAILDWSFLLKALCILVLFVGLVSSLLAWQQPVSLNGINTPELEKNTNIDSVVAGIVMSGITAIYALFLALQIEYLIVDTLPIDFTQAEHLVKSGFWQLCFLSILNVGLFLVVYKNTSSIAQIILRLFIIASGFLLLSAAWRMGLYVYYYGFSYEKFFASYTALFALGIFIFLVKASFEERRKNILRFIAFCSLWSYAVATVLPIEKIILKTNVALQEKTDSRINLGHLLALSVDVLKDVQELKKDNHFFNKYMIKDEKAWEYWLMYRIENNCQRKWYEKNFSLVFNCR